jgi:hypothetical protein
MVGAPHPLGISIFRISQFYAKCFLFDECSVLGGAGLDQRHRADQVH